MMEDFGIPEIPYRGEEESIYDIDHHDHSLVAKTKCSKGDSDNYSIQFNERPNVEIFTLGISPTGLLEEDQQSRQSFHSESVLTGMVQEELPTAASNFNDEHLNTQTSASNAETALLEPKFDQPEVAQPEPVQNELNVPEAVEIFCQNLFKAGVVEFPGNLEAAKICLHILKVCTGNIKLDLQPGDFIWESKRFDQFVKKCLTSWGDYLYVQYKTGKKVTKDEATNKLISAYSDPRLDNNELFNLFGGGRKDGLKNDTITYLLSNRKLFKTMIKREVFDAVIKSLDEQTDSDIKTNIMSKIYETVACSTDPVERLDELKTVISFDRTFKKPFTFTENKLSVIHFLQQLLKKSTKGSDQETELTELRDYYLLELNFKGDLKSYVNRMPILGRIPADFD